MRQPNMFGWQAALGTPLRGEGWLRPPFYPPGVSYSGESDECFVALPRQLPMG